MAYYFNLFKSFVVLWIFLFMGEAMGQNQGSYSFTHLTPKEGLSQSTGQAILQDSEGYMWIGTQDGLNKYDGYEITIYKNNPSDPSSLSHNDVKALLLDNKNNVWIGTLGGGLNLYNKEKDNFTVFDVDIMNPEKGIAESSVFALYEDEKGYLWIGTEGGLSRKDPDEHIFTHFTYGKNDHLSKGGYHIQAIYKDSRGNFWVGTRDGLNKMGEADSSIVRYSHDENDPGSISSNSVFEIYEDKQNNLWVGTENGLSKYNYASDDFDSYTNDPSDPFSLSDNFVQAILEDSKGRLWIGTTSGGLNILDRGTMRFYPNISDVIDPASLNNNAIFSLYENDDELLWVGTFTGGVNLLDLKEPKFQHYKANAARSNTLKNNSILSFLEDNSGNFWIGSDGDNSSGLSKIDFNKDGAPVTNFSHDPLNANSLPSNVVLQMLNAGKDEIWIGTYKGGVTKYNYVEQNFTHYPFTEFGYKRKNSDIYALYLDSYGNVWSGSNGSGIQMLKKGDDKFTPVQEELRDDGLSTDFVRSLFEDSYGNFWIGTYGSGLVLLDRETKEFTFFSDENSSLSNGVVFHIFEDSKKRLWIGTKGGGLNLFDHKTREFSNYTAQDGLPNNIINGILEDSEGYLWLSTNNGISKFNPDSTEFTNYGVEDGLQGTEFILNSAYQDQQGYMYFGGINGFNRFKPENIVPDTTVYPVKITDFQILNKSVEVGDGSLLQNHISQVEGITLPYNTSVITFKYAVLNFNTNKKAKYAYKLDGFNEDWNYVDDKRTATYTNLDHGEYTFMVKVANYDGVWNEEIASVKLIITPPFWRTNWFYLLSILFISGVIVGGFRYRTRKIIQHNKLLEKEVADRTSELSESNQDLKQALNDLKSTREELVEKAHKAGMADIATGVLHNIGNVLNSVTTSTSITAEVLKKSKLEKFFQANQLLKDNKDNLEQFLTADPKGKKLVEYYFKLEDSLRKELELLRSHNQRLDQKTAMISDVIAAQQNYATVGLNSENSNLDTVIEDTLTIFSASMERHQIKLEKDIQETATVKFQRTKLVHVLLNLFKNAKEATELIYSEKIISIKLYQKAGEVFLEISDNGYGIKEENLDKIFTHGFTTKKNGHGFGLHSSANYLAEMGAKIRVSSNGEGDNSGATFKIIFPVVKGDKKVTVNNMETDE